jgi:fermentation-respiration switch protein FrsA (DUF1100 family)
MKGSVVLAGVAKVAVAYSVVVMLVWLVQGRLLYPGTARDDVAPPPDARLATYTARDGAVVHALELDRPAASQTIVYFHGNGEVIGDDLSIAREMVREGFSVVLVEYRGYGVSRPGTPTEEGLYADAEAALDALAKRGVDSKHVVLWGASLGSGVAAEMATRGRGGALVLVTPYTSLVDVAATHFWWLPTRLLMRDRFDTLGKASRITVPTIVFHGTLDEVVPYWMGERVAAAIAHARFVSVKGGHHNDLFAGAAQRRVAEAGAFARGAL